MARMAAFWSLAILYFYGCISLNQELVDFFPSSGDIIGGVKVPVLGADLTAALLISLLVLAAGLYALRRWCETPKIADLLIDTESELRKVTWPTLSEAINSSVVVILCVVFLMAFLAGADWLLGTWAQFLFLGSM